MKNILITGATGFVGSAMCKHLHNETEYNITALVRANSGFGVDCSVVYCDLNEETDYETILSNIDVVIHLAGRAHVLNETENNPYEAFAAINVQATQRLVNAAARLGVKRFIYMSTTKVCGESTTDKPFDERSPINPTDDYAKTKALAETMIQQACENSAMEYVIIRPPLVYGPDVKANFKRLIAISRMRWPLPLGAIHNRRSMIYLENLVDFVSLCIEHPKAANQVFFVSDDEDLSTTRLICSLAEYQGRKSCLIPLPMPSLKMVFNLVQPGLYTKLCDNLQVDINKAKLMLQWTPPFSPEQGLKKSVKVT